MNACTFGSASLMCVKHRLGQLDGGHLAGVQFLANLGNA
jgi:hypothetical protein